MSGEEYLEVKFRLHDGTDIGPRRYLSATTVATLKESVLAQWPKGMILLMCLFLILIINGKCSHYRRRCQIRAPSCNEVFDCRNCHNEAKNSMDVHPHDRHNVPRHEVRKVQQTCVTCGVCMGNYFCEKCNFFDDEDSKQQYHCDGCGICRTGSNDNFFHCYKCGCCHSIRLKDCHPCVEKAMHQRHAHMDHPNLNLALLTVLRMFRFACPVCSKFVCDMSKLWGKLDREVSLTPMPEAYQNKMVWILCNDCGVTSEVIIHIVAHKCQSCNSYNTRQTRGGPSASSCRSHLLYSQMFRFMYPSLPLVRLP